MLLPLVGTANVRDDFILCQRAVTMENQVIERKPIHHPLAMIADGSMRGASNPLIYMANRFLLQGGQ